MSSLQLKMLIALLMLMMVASLFNGLWVLFKDNGAPDSKRTFHRLVIRVTLAAALLACMVYGFMSGKLQSRAPWNNLPTAEQHSAP